MSRAERILVIRRGGLGDFILTLPVLAALRRRFPRARLALLGHLPAAQLAQAGGWVDEVYSIDARGMAALFVRHGALPREVSALFAGCSVVVSYLYDPEGVVQENVARCSRARFIVGPHRPDESLAVHATEIFLRPLECLGILHADPVPRLEMGAARDHSPPGPGSARDPGCIPADGQPDHPAAGTSKAVPVLAAHPGSGSERKNWPEHKWAELLESLVRESDVRLLLIAGEAEGDRVRRLAARLPAPRLRLAEHLPLTDLARRLAPCAAFIGHDSGVSHLAAALGVPAVILWGDTAEAVWRPRGEGVTVLRDPGGLATLPVARVVAAVRALVRGPADPPRGP